MKATITVKMSDEEYADYKKFVNGEYALKKPFGNIYSALGMLGFARMKSSVCKPVSIDADPLAAKSQGIAEFKKGKTTIFVISRE